MRILLAATLAFLLLLVLVGCRTLVEGGTAQHDTGGFRVELPTPSGLLVIVDDRDSVATTQPSVETNTGQLPTIGAAKEGTLGSLSLAALPPVRRDNLILGGALVASGLFFIFSPIPLLRQVGTGVILCAAGVVTILYPMVAAIGAVVAAAYYLYRLNEKGKQEQARSARVVKSVDVAVEKAVPDSLRPAFFAAMKGEQSPDDAKAVKKLKAL